MWKLHQNNTKFEGKVKIWKEENILGTISECLLIGSDFSNCD